MNPEQLAQLRDRIAKGRQPLTRAEKYGHPRGWNDAFDTVERWIKEILTPNKTERECLNGCGTIKVTHHQHEGGRNVEWTSYFRGLDEFARAPVCEPAQEEVPA